MGYKRAASGKPAGRVESDRENRGLVVEETAATRCCSCQGERSAIDRSWSISGEIFMLVGSGGKAMGYKRVASGRSAGRGRECPRKQRDGGGQDGRDALLQLPRC